MHKSVDSHTLAADTDSYFICRGHAFGIETAKQTKNDRHSDETMRHSSIPANVDLGKHIRIAMRLRIHRTTVQTKWMRCDVVYLFGKL